DLREARCEREVARLRDITEARRPDERPRKSVLLILDDGLRAEANACQASEYGRIRSGEGDKCVAHATLCPIRERQIGGEHGCELACRVCFREIAIVF